MKVLIQFLVLTKLLIASIQALPITDGQHNDNGLVGGEEVALTSTSEELGPEDKGIRVPIISEIHNLLKPTKPSHESPKQDPRPVAARPPPFKPQRPLPPGAGAAPIQPIDEFDDHNNYAGNPPHIYNPKPNVNVVDEYDMDGHWSGNGPKRPTNAWPQPAPSGQSPQSVASGQWDADPDFPYNNNEVPPNKPANTGREPNTIQEWMNENRPVSQQKPSRIPPIESKEPAKPIMHQPAPWDLPVSNPSPPHKPDGRPPPIKPSFQPAPWERPATRPDEDDNDYNQWWDTTPKPKQPFHDSFNDWEGEDVGADNPDKPKYRPKPQPSKPVPVPAPEWWDEAPGHRPEPEPEFEPQPHIPHKPSKPEIPQGWTGNPNIPNWWNDKPQHSSHPEPEPEDDNNGWGGNVFGENTGNGIGGVGDTNGIGGAMVGNGSGNGEGGVGSQNGIGGNLLQNNAANGVGGVGNDNGQGGFVVGHDSGNGKGGVGNNNGVGGNKGGKNSANGTGGVGNNNGKGGLIIGSHSGNGVGGVNQNIPPPKPNHKP